MKLNQFKSIGFSNRAWKSGICAHSQSLSSRLIKKNTRKMCNPFEKIVFFFIGWSVQYRCSKLYVQFQPPPTNSNNKIYKYKIAKLLRQPIWKVEHEQMTRKIDEFDVSQAKYITVLLSIRPGIFSRFSLLPLLFSFSFLFWFWLFLLFANKEQSISLLLITGAKRTDD